MIDRVDRNVQRLLHMLTGIKRLKKMMETVGFSTWLVVRSQGLVVRS